MVGEEPDEIPWNEWEVVELEFSSESGNIGASTAHSPKSELEDLKDEVLAEIEIMEENPSGFRGDDFFDELDLEGIPDEIIVDREYSHKVVALFAISTGIMESQIKRLLRENFINSRYQEDESVEEFLGSRSMKKNTELAHDLGLIGDGVFGQIEDVRTYRNKLVHEPNSRLHIESFEQERDRIKKAVRGPDLLNEVLKGER